MKMAHADVVSMTKYNEVKSRDSVENEDDSYRWIPNDEVH